MDNQQVYYTYCSFDCAGKYYIGYTRHHIDTNYKGSYCRASGFEPKCRINLYEGEKIIAMWLEHMYHRIWQVSTNKQFVNKANANIWSTRGFDAAKETKQTAEFRQKMSLVWSRPGQREAMIKAQSKPKHAEHGSRVSEGRKAWMKANPELKRALDLLQACSQKINGIRAHLAGTKLLKKHSKKTEADLYNELQRLERELVVLKSQYEKLRALKKQGQDIVRTDLKESAELENDSQLGPA